MGEQLVQISTWTTGPGAEPRAGILFLLHHFTSGKNYMQPDLALRFLSDMVGKE
jgi:hypothetical protein